MNFLVVHIDPTFKYKKLSESKKKLFYPRENFRELQWFISISITIEGNITPEKKTH